MVCVSWPAGLGCVIYYLVYGLVGGWLLWVLSVV